MPSNGSTPMEETFPPRIPAKAGMIGVMMFIDDFC